MITTICWSFKSIFTRATNECGGLLYVSGMGFGAFEVILRPLLSDSMRLFHTQLKLESRHDV
jgi:hypothetical protein